MSVFIHLFGAIALLLWGLRMVRTGVLSAYGPKIRRLARQSEGRIIPAFVSGIFVALILQSGAATAMIAASFSAQGVLSTSAALLIILGADVGTALAVLIASQKIEIVSPLLIAAGVFGYMSTENSRLKSLFRAAIGLGLILLALSMISTTATELTRYHSFNTVLGLIAAQPVWLALFGMGLSYLAHSSLAIVLLTTSFVASEILSVPAGLYVVLGANIGSGLLPLVANWNAKLKCRVPLVANFLLRLVGVIIVFPFVDHIISAIGTQIPSAQIPALCHLAFNLGVAFVGLIVCDPLVNWLARVLPPDPSDDEFISPQYLDESAIRSPAIALSSAKREALAMADLAQKMVRESLPALKSGDDQLRKNIIATDDSVDRLFNAIKLYIARVMQLKLTEGESQRAMDLLSFTTDMEHIGDIVDGSLMDLVSKKNQLQIEFSKEGMAEITDLHHAVCENFDLAINTFLSEDPELARELYSAKADVRKIERESVSTHLERIGAGQSDSLGTSGLHMDILRDLKRINSHLTSIAYPVLLRSGEVPKTKWKRKR